MLIAFPDVQKAPDDILTVDLDWTPFAPAGATITAHDAYPEVGTLTAFAWGGGIPPGLAEVVAQDAGITGLVQHVRLSAGNLGGYSAISGSVTFSDGTKKVRSFLCMVR